MVRSMLAIAAGYFSIVFLNSITHLIVSVYFKNEVSLTGIAQLPSTVWVVGFTILQFVFGLFGGLLATTLARTKQHIEILVFILLMVIIAILDYTVLSEREPTWYLITSPALKIVGIVSGYQIFQSQQKNTENT